MSHSRLFLYLIWGRNGGSFFFPFFIPGCLTFEARKYFFVKDCPIHCMMFSSIPGLYQLDASSAPTQLWLTKMSPDIAKYLLPQTPTHQDLVGALPQVENYWFTQLFWHHPFTIKLSVTKRYHHNAML